MRPVSAAGVDVGADVKPVLGDEVAGEPAGDLLLDPGRAQVTFADVAVRPPHLVSRER